VPSVAATVVVTAAVATVAMRASKDHDGWWVAPPATASRTTKASAVQPKGSPNAPGTGGDGQREKLTCTVHSTCCARLAVIAAFRALPAFVLTTS
jgi:cobalamin synthase